MPQTWYLCYIEINLPKEFSPLIFNLASGTVLAHTQGNKQILHQNFSWMSSSPVSNIVLASLWNTMIETAIFWFPLSTFCLPGT